MTWLIQVLKPKTIEQDNNVEPITIMVCSPFDVCKIEMNGNCNLWQKDEWWLSCGCHLSLLSL